MPAALQEEVANKVHDFRDVSNHKSLKVHKLSGRLNSRYAFSVDYQTRVIFVYLPTKPREAYLLSVGNHDVYNR